MTTCPAMVPQLVELATFLIFGCFFTHLYEIILELVPGSSSTLYATGLLILVEFSTLLVFILRFIGFITVNSVVTVQRGFFYGAGT